MESKERKPQPAPDQVRDEYGTSREGRQENPHRIFRDLGGVGGVGGVGKMVSTIPVDGRGDSISKFFDIAGESVFFNV